MLNIDTRRSVSFFLKSKTGSFNKSFSSRSAQTERDHKAILKAPNPSTSTLNQSATLTRKKAVYCFGSVVIVDGATGLPSDELRFTNVRIYNALSLVSGKVR